ncbi:MAG: hypothetical protein HY876_03335 [Coriobacteriales bacterium]|nr:hypothetical protein [Coriobacteriales bacterium]
MPEPANLPSDPVSLTDGSSTASTAARIFAALQPLHHLQDSDVDLLSRSAVALAHFRSVGPCTIERKFSGHALRNLHPCQAAIVETVSLLAADVPSVSSGEAVRCRPSDIQRRTLWLAAILRLADGLCSAIDASPDGVFAVWTDECVFLEVDGVELSPRSLMACRVAALGAASGRRFIIASSHARRGAA